jgi:prepilin-type N-terminal cleavage/methylation domain-containing protein/prepilin-type processing-associated H-X9-DG protein
MKKENFNYPVFGKREGFTLIELLVVISIIALLMAIMMPALSKVRSIAKATICSTQLRQVGVASLLYAQDNDSRVVSATFNPSSSPAEFWYNLLRPYINLTGDHEGQSAEVFICPNDKTSGGLFSKGADRVNGLRDADTWRQHSYGINGQTQTRLDNGHIVGEKMSKIKNGSSFALASEIQWWLLNTNFTYPHKWIPASWDPQWWFDAMPGSPNPTKMGVAIEPVQWHEENVNVLFIDGSVNKLAVETFYEDQPNENIWVVK